jgi:RNA polymerase sigma-70 factor (ECF subfamily)
VAGTEGVDAIAERMSEREAFADLVRPHWDVLAALASRLGPAGESEDVLQDALADAWRKRSQFDAVRGTARNWLLAIVADQAYKSRRRVRRTTVLAEVSSDGATDGDLDLHAALRKLSRRQRLAVELHYYLGFPLADVAALMDCAEGTVKSTLSDARSRLRQLLGEDDG